MKLERIVIGIDFSPPSLEAAHWVATHFAPTDVEFILVHVIAIPQPPPVVESRYGRRELLIETVREGADRRLRELSLSLGAPRVWLEIREGDPASSLATVAADYSADLLVVGAHGERAGILEGLGTTAEHLVRHATTPVLLATSLPEHKPARILAALDESDMSRGVLRLARSLGTRFDASVTALHIVPASVMSHVLAATATISGAPFVAPESFRSGTQAAEYSWLDKLVEDTADAGGSVRCEIAFGAPAQEIAAFAERERTDVIVVGRRRAGDLRRAVLGSVVSTVLKHAPCPVLVLEELATG